MADKTQVTRRDFLRLAGASLGGLALPPGLTGMLAPADAWPAVHLDELPSFVREILRKVPPVRVEADGYVYLPDPRGGSLGRAPVAQTQWNLEHHRLFHRLYYHVPWGIVLHWYADRENFDRTVKGYLRGFDSLHKVDDIEIRTSAHFLVGDSLPETEQEAAQTRIGILQTQKPDQDGWPFLASHLQPIDKVAHIARKQYFVRALYQLGYAEPAVHSLLQDLYDGPYLDANMRTIAIEITGYDFESAEHFPSAQKIANVLGLVWALMKRYNIQASGLLGHHEVQLNKADPGKKFMALMRYLLGVKALLENDPQMKGLAFGQYLAPGGDPLIAIYKYFKFTRDYLAMVSFPRRVFEWEAVSKYWYTYDRLFGRLAPVHFVKEIGPPMQGSASNQGRIFLDPANHEGTDLYPEKFAAQARKADPGSAHLIAGGKCLYAGPVRGCAGGLAGMFQHQLADGTQILSVYSHLAELGGIAVGGTYPLDTPVGRLMQAPHPWEDPFFHFAIAYGATWDTQLSHGPDIPLNAGPKWIADRYLSPLAFLNGSQDSTRQNFPPVALE